MHLTKDMGLEIAGLCRKLISIPSCTGQEGEIALAVQAEMLARGYDRAWIDEVGNVAGVVKGAHPGQRVLFDGHLDTVPVTAPARWQHQPFAGEIDGGRIYGRGAADMKGALAAMVYTGGELAKQKENLCGEIYVSGTVHEEVAEGIALSHLLEEIRPDVVVIGEASELKINIGQRGRAELVVETLGKAAHSSNPSVGVNAVYQMVKAIAALQQLQLPTDELLGPALLELTDIISKPYPGVSVVPEYCRVTYDRRLLVGDTRQDIIQDLQAVVDKLKAGEQSFQARVTLAENDFKTYTGYKVTTPRFAPAWKIDKQHPVVEKAVQSIARAGLEPVLSAYAFCTNGSSAAGIYGIPTIGFGPGRETAAHIDDEYLELGQLWDSARGYYHLALGLAGNG